MVLFFSATGNCKYVATRILRQKGALDIKFPCGGLLHWLRPVCKEMPGAGNQDAGCKACLGEGKMRDVPRLPASLPAVCNPVWQSDKESRPVYQSQCNGIIFCLRNRKLRLVP